MNNIQFGSINIETGETQTGYIDKNGEMAYKKQPWYKRIFQKRPEKTEYIGTTQLWSKLIWSNNKHYFDVAVYKVFNPYNNEIYELYSNTSHGKFYYNIDAFKSNDILIPN